MLESLNVLAPVVVLPHEGAEEDRLQCVYATIRLHLASILDRYLDPVRQDNELPLLRNADGQAMVDLSMYHENSIEFLTEM
ncbi:hypothetical protein HJFPF1_02208 [Paramyrothecium foliicola]|nr:hypothetical protein HJFPF1_02208 [Paramyrothecium foliicola]